MYSTMTKYYILRGTNTDGGWVAIALSLMVAAVTHQTCLVLWTWRKLADETNVKNTPKIC